MPVPVQGALGRSFTVCVASFLFCSVETDSRVALGGLSRYFRDCLCRRPLAIKKGMPGLMEIARMSDHDRLDRIERKLKRIGKYVLFGVALFTVLLAVEMQNMSSDIFFGYGRFALWSFVGVMTVMRLVARAPFRDWARIRLSPLWREFCRTLNFYFFAATQCEDVLGVRLNARQGDVVDHREHEYILKKAVHQGFQLRARCAGKSWRHRAPILTGMAGPRHSIGPRGRGASAPRRAAVPRRVSGAIRGTADE